jgi:hypothetical protein
MLVVPGTAIQAATARRRQRRLRLLSATLMRSADTMSIAMDTEIASIMVAAAAAVAATAMRSVTGTTGTTAIAVLAMVGMDGVR